MITKLKVSHLCKPAYIPFVLYYLYQYSYKSVYRSHWHPGTELSKPLCAQAGGEEVIE